MPPRTLTRRQAIQVFGAVPFAALAATQETPLQLAPGAPNSRERTALIEAFREKSDGLDGRFERRVHRGAWNMPYRLFRASSKQKVPLVLYLHGSGGLGDDNQKQLGLGNVFGTRVWALPDNQARHPCFVLAPQTDRGWIDYSQHGGAPPQPLAGFGAGNRLALDIVHALMRELPIDPAHLYLAGQSMGGAGVWNMLAYHPRIFAAAVICCGSVSLDDVTPAASVPLWNFHGDADRTVPVEISRRRISVLQRAGGHPRSTEYPGVDHNVWEWAFTEPALGDWLFVQRRGA